MYLSNMKKSIIFWFRRDLRLNDNAGLYAALSSGLPVLPIFIFDTTILSQLPDRYDRRVDMIYQCLSAIKKELQKYNSDLLVFHGTPRDVFEQLTRQYAISAIYTNTDYEPYATQRDAEIKAYATRKHIDFVDCKDQVIFESHEVLSATGKPYTVYSHFAKTWKKQYTETHVQPFPSETLLKNCYPLASQSLITLEELGFQKTDYEYTPYHIPADIIANYHATRDIPSVQGTSRVSEHLRFGTVSIRHLVAYARTHNETWCNELIWREFFMAILHQNPQVVTHNFKKQYDALTWRNKEDEFAAWCAGKTGYPLVDAGMRELNTTGYMHNRVRMITASFLCKHLLIDWRWGEAYFAQKLTDYELSSNNGNWQWAASTGCDAVPYFRVFNPSTQQERFDPDKCYIQTWLPEYGTPDYPAPIVEHTMARKRVIEEFKKASRG